MPVAPGKGALLVQDIGERLQDLHVAAYAGFREAGAAQLPLCIPLHGHCGPGDGK